MCHLKLVFDIGVDDHTGRVLYDIHDITHQNYQVLHVRHPNTLILLDHSCQVFELLLRVQLFVSLMCIFDCLVTAFLVLFLPLLDKKYALLQLFLLVCLTAYYKNH